MIAQLHSSSIRGAWRIVELNWPMYGGALLASVVAGCALVLLSLPKVFVWVGLCGAGVAVFWMVTSVLASYWVYDRSGLYNWQWLARLFPVPPIRWLNIHCGFDESSVALRRCFPHSDGVVADIFDSAVMGEPSIHRGREAATGAPPALPAKPTTLPMLDEAFDAVFVLFAAHEIRDETTRLAFGNEVARVLKPGGRMVLVEHLRDTANFLAFGPGFMHFLPHRAWQLATAGLDCEREFRFTPFVRVFVMRKQVHASLRTLTRRWT